MGATSKSKRERWNEVAGIEKKCPHCPPHKGENAEKRPRPDRYKDKRKGK